MNLQEYIDKIAEYAKKYAPQYGYGVVSAIIAQGLLECGVDNVENETGLFPYNNFFGLKCGGAWHGKSVNMATQEEYEIGVMTDIRDNFRVFDSFEEGVKGYFNFLDWYHYDNIKGVTSPREYIELLKEDAYATASDYVDSICGVMDSYNLYQYDSEDTEPQEVDTSNDESIKNVYDTILHREPDESGLENYRNYLATGSSIGDMKVDLASGDEAMNNYVDAIIKATYKAVLHREPDADGLENYRNFINSGATVKEVCNALASSEEIKNL